MVSDIQIDNYYIDLLLCQKKLFPHHCELNLLARITSQKSDSLSKGIDSVYPNHANACCEAVHAQSILTNLVGSPKPIKKTNTE